MPAQKTQIIGYPVRPAFFEATREEAARRLGLERDLPLLLISGASSGASRLNDGDHALVRRLPPSKDRSSTFRAPAMSPGSRPPEGCRRATSRYHLHAYLHEDMPYALAAANLAIMRSGASVLGECLPPNLPAIPVPGEYEGWDQSANARYLEDRAPLSCSARLDIGQLHDRRRGAASQRRPSASRRACATATGALANARRLAERPRAACVVEMARASKDVRRR